MNWPWEERDGRRSLLKATFFVATVYPAVWALYHLETGGFGPLPKVGLIYWSGVWATFLLLATLLVTPLARILAWGRLVAVRRMLGVAALFYTLAHVVLWFALFDWNLPAIGADLVRPSLIVATLSTAGLIALGATSFDRAVKRIGRNWKRLHRFNYVLSGLAVLHYLLSPGIFTLQYVTTGVFIWAMVWRRAARYRRGVTILDLLLLACTAAALTFVVEVLWLSVYHDVPTAETLAAAGDFTFGVPAIWVVLSFGLAVAAAAAVRRLL